MDKSSVPVKKDSKLSLSEQITGVVRQPAFMAGLGVASWLVLMGISGWLHCRHRRRKQLGHYTTSFAYTPAGVLFLNTIAPHTPQNHNTCRTINAIAPSVYERLY